MTTLWKAVPHCSGVPGCDARPIVGVGLPCPGAAGSPAERRQPGAGSGVVPALRHCAGCARRPDPHLYCGHANSRVLGWADIASYQIGDAPGVVLGQPGPQYSNLLGIGVKGFNGPLGLAVDPLTGNLYVADFNNNRVLRFLSPFANPTPDRTRCGLWAAEFQQPHRSRPLRARSLNQPRAVAFDSAGNLWVADSGNHRVVRFSAAVLNSQTPPAADTVIGQKDFFSNSANAGGQVSGSGLDTPTALAFDSQGNLYVSDGRNSRVLRFSAPLGPSSGNPTASAVWGQSNFAARGTPLQASSSTIAVPGGLAIDGSGNLYVAAPSDNRVLVFSTSTTLGGAAKSVIGQSDFATTTANTGAFPLASANSLSGPADVKVDQNGNVFVADTANNRVLEFPPNAKSGSRVWGQSDFVSNGANQIKPASISFPYHMAIDYSSAPFALYVSDTANHRVLVWKDSVRFRNGDPADLVIGQPNLRTGVANVDTQGSANPSKTSLSAPQGIAVNPSDGTSMGGGLREQPRAALPAAGEPERANLAGCGDRAGGFHQLAIGGSERDVAEQSQRRGDRAERGSLRGGQRQQSCPGVSGRGGERGGGGASVRAAGHDDRSTSNAGFRADAGGAAGNRRGSGEQPVRGGHRGQPRADFSQHAERTGGRYGGGVRDWTGELRHEQLPANLKTPTDVGVDSSGTIYVADNGNNRVLIYPSLVFLPLSGGTPTGVVGQQSTTGVAPNYNSPDGLATAEGLYSPRGDLRRPAGHAVCGRHGQQPGGAISQSCDGGQRGDVSGQRAGGTGIAGDTVRRRADAAIRSRSRRRPGRRPRPTGNSWSTTICRRRSITSGPHR